MSAAPIRLTRRAAGAYVNRGLSVLPLDGKTPVTEHGVKDATTDIAQIDVWFARDCNIGIAIPDGVAIVDIDPRNGGMESFTEWVATYGEEHFAGVPRVHTGGGGAHYWFKMPPGVTKLKKNPAQGIDLLTVGRYVVAPPSVTTGAYSWEVVLPAELAELPELPGYIAALAAVEPRAVGQRPARPPYEGEDPLAKAVHQMTDWESLLTRHGWSPVGQNKWRHPSSENAHSATITHDCLFVYSPNTPFPQTTDGDPHGVTLYSALETLEFGGDRTACIQALRDAGLLSEPVRRTAVGELVVPATQSLCDAGYLPEPACRPEVGELVGTLSDQDGRGRGLLPEIVVPDSPPRDLAERGLDLLVEGNEPPTMFVAGNRPVRLERGDDGWPILQPWTVERVVYELSYVADWYSRTRSGGLKPVGPPQAVAKQILATPDLPLPSLVRLVEAPVFGVDGSLQLEAGYHAASRTLYVPAQGFIVPPVSTSPTVAELAAARDVIGELLYDFPFADQASYAHAIALMLLPFVRDLIDGPTPLHLFDKPVAGSGASLLVQVLCAPALGHAPPFGTDANTDEEWRKRITAALMTGPTVMVFDNLTGQLRSPSLMAAITGVVWEDRILGKSEIGRWPVRCAWVATSNNLTLKRDLVRRTVYCRLDPNTDHPEDRTEFRHELPRYAYDQRPQLVWAVLTAVQGWLAAGGPAPSCPPLGSFEAWTHVVGGVLETLGIDGFLGNRESLRDNADLESEPEQWLLEEWWDHDRENHTTVAKLYNMVSASTDVPADLVHGHTEQELRASLASRVRDMRDRVFTLDSGIKVRVGKGTKVKGVQRWHLRQVGEAPACEPQERPVPDGAALTLDTVTRG